MLPTHSDRSKADPLRGSTSFLTRTEDSTTKLVDMRRLEIAESVNVNSNVIAEIFPSASH